MIVDGVHWGVAFLTAMLIHLAGLFWFDPPQKVISKPADQYSEYIVVSLEQGPGEGGETASLTDFPNQTAKVEPADITRSTDAVQEQAAIDLKAEVEQVASPSAARHTDVDTVESGEAAPVNTLAPTSTQNVTAPGALTEQHDPAAVPSVDAPEQVVARQQAVDTPRPIGPSSAVQEQNEVNTSAAVIAPAQTTTTQTLSELATTWASVEETTRVSDPVPDRTEQAVDEVVDIAGVEPPAAPATVSDPVPDRTEQAVDEVVDIAGVEPPAAPATVLDPVLDRPQSFVKSTPVPLVEEPSQQPLADIETQRELDSALAALVIDLDVATIRQSRPSDTAIAETPATDQIARAVTLEELQASEKGGGVVARYAGTLKGWLQENMHYPRAARLAGQEGRAVVRFIIDRWGRVLAIQLESSSGYAILDREALEMIERAEPFPAIPEEMETAELELRVPVSFDIKDESLIRKIPPILLE